jgi:hypothetical protein
MASTRRSWLQAERVLDIAKRTDAVGRGAQRRRVAVPARDGRADGWPAVPGDQDLGAAFEGILDEFRRRYVIGFTPRGVPAGGWHPLVVRIKGQRATTRARPGYLAGGG